MSQTLRYKLALRDHLKTDEKVPVDTYYADLANGFLSILVIGFLVGLAYAVFIGELPVFAIWILVLSFLTIIGVVFWHMAGLFVERNEP